jgi:hypothetical protein
MEVKEEDKADDIEVDAISAQSPGARKDFGMTGVVCKDTGEERHGVERSGQSSAVVRHRIGMRRSHKSLP